MTPRLQPPDLAIVIIPRNVLRLRGLCCSNTQCPPETTALESIDTKSSNSKSYPRSFAGLWPSWMADRGFAGSIVGAAQARCPVAHVAKIPLGLEWSEPREGEERTATFIARSPWFLRGDHVPQGGVTVDAARRRVWWAL